MSSPKTLRCYYCDKELLEEEMVIKPIPLNTKRGIRNYKRKFHYECLPKFIKENKVHSEKKNQEASDWDKVYKYFLHDVLGYKKLERKKNEYMAQRIQGLRVGKFIPHATNTRVVKQGYSFEAIYYTMKFCKAKLDYANSHVKFKDFEHQVNYLMKIIISNIDFINQKLQRKKKADERVEKTITNQIKEQPKEPVLSTYKARGSAKRKFDLD